MSRMWKSILRGLRAPRTVTNKCSVLPEFPAWQYQQVAYVRDYKALDTYDDVEFPERVKLKVLEKVPPLPVSQKPPKSMKRLIDMRGPELIHNKLIHKQYGIVAITGGQLKHGHIEMMRLTINRKMDERRMFAVWRIDAPWKPITKKGQGHRMGGGKGSIDHYTTPVKAGRIIVEMGGKCSFDEVQRILTQVSKNLPFKARVVTQEMMEEEEELEQSIRKNNLNPFDFKYLIENNFFGIQKWLSPYDYKWHGKYR